VEGGDLDQDVPFGTNNVDTTKKGAALLG